MSEEEKLTTHEALATAEMAASDWTPYNLATFMGTMRTGSSQHKLQVSECSRRSAAPRRRRRRRGGRCRVTAMGKKVSEAE